MTSVTNTLASTPKAQSEGRGTHTITLPKTTLDQQEYLSNLQMAASSYDPETVIRGHNPAVPTPSDPERVRHDGDGEPTAAEKAYGALWRDCTVERGSKPHTARKLLLASLDPAGQRRGIAWALGHFGPVTDAEVCR